MNTIRYHRLKNDWTLDELGKRAGVSAQYLCDIELGKKPLSDRIALKLSEIFGVSIGEVRGRVDV